MVAVLTSGSGATFRSLCVGNLQTKQAAQATLPPPSTPTLGGKQGSRCPSFLVPILQSWASRNVHTERVTCLPWRCSSSRVAGSAMLDGHGRRCFQPKSQVPLVGWQHCSLLIPRHEATRPVSPDQLGMQEGTGGPARVPLSGTSASHPLHTAVHRCSCHSAGALMGRQAAFRSVSLFRCVDEACSIVRCVLTASSWSHGPEA